MFLSSKSISAWLSSTMVLPGIIVRTNRSNFPNTPRPNHRPGHKPEASGAPMTRSLRGNGGKNIREMAVIKMEIERGSRTARTGRERFTVGKIGLSFYYCCKAKASQLLDPQHYICSFRVFGRRGSDRPAARRTFFQRRNTYAKDNLISRYGR